MDYHHPSFLEAMLLLIERRDLGEAPMRAAMEDLIAGRWGEAEMAGFLMALRVKGETATEIAAAAAVLRRHMVRFETGCPDVLDTCGTGGDGIGTFNISTAAALVVAGAGVAVVKHGNRAVSSLSGSADVMAALGVAVEGNAAGARRCLHHAGLAFCFAPHFHPALCHVGAVRSRLRVGTLFNCLGPLANPGNAPYQLIGVGRQELLDPLAGAVALLGTRRTVLVCGCDGLDEVSLSASTRVREVRGHEVTAREWTSQDFGLAPCQLSDLRASGPDQSAGMIRAVLEGQNGPATRVVLANAAAGLYAAERVETLAQGVELAAQAVATGRARKVLEALIACSRE